MKKRINITIGAMLVGMFMLGALLAVSLSFSDQSQTEMQAQEMVIDMDKSISVLP